MTHRSTAGSRFSKRIALAVVAVTMMTVGSPAIAASSASQAGGLHRQVPAGFGDCKNHNSGLHNGYECPDVDGGIVIL
jgi:hypothetical protein